MKQIQDSFKIDPSFKEDSQWGGAGLGFVANLNFKTATVERLCGQATSCKDYLKVAALAVHSKRDWTGALAPKEPYHFKYTSWCRIAGLRPTNMVVMNKLEAKWNIAPTQHTSIKDQGKTFDLFVGDPVWMKSVELLATFIMMCRNSYDGNEVPSAADYAAFLREIYPKLDSLEELCQYGVVNLNWDKLGENKDRLASPSEINGTLHNYIGPYSIAMNYYKHMGVYTPEKNYYDYFKSKAIPISKPTLEKVSY